MGEFIFTTESMEQLVYFSDREPKTFKKIYALLTSIDREGPTQGLGKPEPLRFTTGYSRRIDKKNRLVYDMEGDRIVIKSCKGHYDD